MLSRGHEQPLQDLLERLELPSACSFQRPQNQDPHHSTSYQALRGTLTGKILPVTRHFNLIPQISTPLLETLLPSRRNISAITLIRPWLPNSLNLPHQSNNLSQSHHPSSTPLTLGQQPKPTSQLSMSAHIQAQSPSGLPYGKHSTNIHQPINTHSSPPSSATPQQTSMSISRKDAGTSSPPKQAR